MDEKLYSASEVARITGLSRRRVDQYAKQYGVPQLGGYAFVFQQEHLDDIMSRMRPETCERIKERRRKSES